MVDRDRTMFLTTCRSHSNGSFSCFRRSGTEVVILSNTAGHGPSATVEWAGQRHTIYAGSSLLLSGGKLLFNSSIDSDGPTVAVAVTLSATADTLTWRHWREPITKRRGFDASTDRNATTPEDQVHVTNDLTDYLWYSTEVEFATAGAYQLELTTGIGSAFLVYLDGKLVGADDDHTHTGSHGATRLDARGNMSFGLAVTEAGTHRLDLMSVSMGINNWLGVEDNFKGLLAGSDPPGPGLPRGKMQLVANATGAIHDLTANGWLMQPQLEGQRLSLQSGGSPPVPWAAAGASAMEQTLTWFETEFVTPGGTEPLVLDIGGLGRGHAYVNGFDIGRYYNITGTPCDQCKCGGDSCCMKVRASLHCSSSSPDFAVCVLKTELKQNSCVARPQSMCGKPSQQLYHIPPDALLPAGAASNLLVLFEELGATDLSTVQVRRYTA